MPTARGYRVYRWGDWERARSIFHGLSFRLQKAAEAGLWEEAKAAARRVKNNIYRQNYPHHPLSHWQATAKSRNGQDPRILIADGSYVHAIKAMHLGRGVFGVGIGREDQKNASKGKLHEWGGRNNLGHLVPARPHYRVELERMQNGRLLTLADYLRQALHGRTYLSGNGGRMFGIDDRSELEE